MCTRLEADELDKVSRLNKPLNILFSASGRPVRCCEARIIGGQRYLLFFRGLVGMDHQSAGHVLAARFVTTPDAVAADTISLSTPPTGD